MRFRCPHCGKLSRVFSTRQISALTTEHYTDCTDAAGCDHRFVVRTEIAYTIRPSIKPNPRIVLPFSIKAAPPAELPMPANDGGQEELAEA